MTMSEASSRETYLQMQFTLSFSTKLYVFMKNKKIKRVQSRGEIYLISLMLANWINMDQS